MTKLAVDMQKITVRFGKVIANNEVDFQAEWGEVHGLVGENGAGKTTLMRVLYGMYTHHEGTMLINGGSLQFSQGCHSQRNRNGASALQPGAEHDGGGKRGDRQAAIQKRPD